VGVGVGVGVGAGLIVNLTVFVPVSLLVFLALRTTLLNVPAVVGVPEITPVVVFTVKPGGNPVAPQRVIGLWFAVIW
jgi:hypothetical protein